MGETSVLTPNVDYQVKADGFQLKDHKYGRPGQAIVRSQRQMGRIMGRMFGAEKSHTSQMSQEMQWNGERFISLKSFQGQHFVGSEGRCGC